MITFTRIQVEVPRILILKHIRVREWWDPG